MIIQDLLVTTCRHLDKNHTKLPESEQFFTRFHHKNENIAVFSSGTSKLETVQDFLIKLNINPLMHLLETGIFSLNNDLVRLTKIMKNLVKDLKIRFDLIFKVLYLLKRCPIFVCSVHNSGKSEDDIIQYLFPIDALVV